MDLLAYSPKSRFPEDSDELTCILLHGIFGMSSNLQSLAKGISEEFATVIYDLPNHGESPRMSNCNFVDMAVLLKQSMDEQIPSKNIHLAGHSMGGKLALIFSLLYPEVAQSLIMMDIAPVEYPPFHLNVIEGLRDVLQKQPGTRNEAIEILNSHLEDMATATFIAKSLVFEQGKVTSVLAVEELASSYDVLRSFPEKEMQGKIFTKETLLLIAESSQYFNDSYFSAVEKYCPSWELDTVPNSGHNIHVDNLSYTTNAIVSFYQYL